MTSEVYKNEQKNSYLTFELENESFGLEILKVKEIISLLPITPVPQTPHFIKGVINLRGQVIPVVDLRLKLNMPPKEPTYLSSIIVVELQEQTNSIPIGVIVDQVSEVLNIPFNDIEQKISFAAVANTDYFLGMAKTKEGVKLILNVNKIFSAQEFC